MIQSSLIVLLLKQRARYLIRCRSKLAQTQHALHTTYPAKDTHTIHTMTSSNKFNTTGAATSSGPMQRPNAPGNKAAASSASCLCCHTSEKLEYLDYDYTKDDIRNTNKTAKPQPYPRIRERGEYYIDTFNDQPWACTFGTGEHVR